MLSQYQPVLMALFAVHVVSGVAFVFFKLKPSVDNGDMPKVEGSGFAKLIELFDLYAIAQVEKGRKGWDYYYARAFKVLHLVAMAIIVVIIADVLLRRFNSGG